MDSSILSDLADVFFLVVISLGSWYLSQLGKRIATVERELKALQKELEKSDSD